MKVNYMCEKCERLFDSYDECKMHEEMHLAIDQEYPCYRNELEKLYMYTNESGFPAKIVLQSKQGPFERVRFGVYKFSRELDDTESDDIIAEGNARIKHEAEQMEKWRAAQEAQKKES